MRDKQKKEEMVERIAKEERGLVTKYESERKHNKSVVGRMCIHIIYQG